MDGEAHVSGNGLGLTPVACQPCADTRADCDADLLAATALGLAYARTSGAALRLAKLAAGCQEKLAIAQARLGQLEVATRSDRDRAVESLREARSIVASRQAEPPRTVQ